MRQDTKVLYNHFMMQHTLMLRKLKAWGLMEKDNYDAMELVDTSYALREIAAFLEDTVKEIRKMEKMAHAKCGVIVMQSGHTGPLKTEYCSGTVKVKEIPDLPKLHKDPERYHAFMEFLGVPEDMVEKDIFRLSWKSFMDWYNKRLADGLPTPPGLQVDKTHTTAELMLRKKKDIEFIQKEN